MKMYEEKLYMLDVYKKLNESAADVATGKTKNAKEALKHIRKKRNV